MKTKLKELKMLLRQKEIELWGRSIAKFLKRVIDYQRY